mmetsp:Transcript_28911/g.46207  ORF Transcript_28911/g.46207 Transcript_28911/m.46207 type:complete len:572 (-) Transcript_28911:8-1723(-)
MLLLDLAVAAAACNPLIRWTDEGFVQGHTYGVGHALVHEFLGIPFAAPAVGDLRFAPPAPPAFRSGIYEADYLAPECPQNKLYAPGGLSEDCLYLSIWTPPSATTRYSCGKNDSKIPGDPSESRHISSELLPVYLFFYGGSYVEGAGAGYGSGPEDGSKFYNGRILSTEQNNVIVVTMNYRIGALGFVKPPGLVGNYGFDDQLASLQWISKNIKYFGGDPSRVTIGGQSAGAQSVATHLGSPRSQPYFNQAIMESAPLGLPFHNNETAGKVAVDYLRAVGCPKTTSEGPDIKCLRSLPLEVLLIGQIIAQAIDFSIFDIFKDFEAYNPTVTGFQDTSSKLPEQPFFAIANSSLLPSPGKKVLAGSCLNDALPFVESIFFFPVVPFLAHIINILVYGAHDTKVIEKTYPNSFPDSRAAVSKAATDMLFYCSLRNLTRRAEYQGLERDTYLYRFEQIPNNNEDSFLCKDKVCHSAELRFVFGEFDDQKVTPEEISLSKKMIQYWVNFIHTGNPNTPAGGSSELPKWPKYVSAMDEILILGGSGNKSGDIYTAAGVEAEECDTVWDKIGFLCLP